MLWILQQQSWSAGTIQSSSTNTAIGGRVTCNADVPRDAITVCPTRLWRYHHRMAQLGVTPLILHLELPFLGKALGPFFFVLAVSEGGPTGTRRRGTKSHATKSSSSAATGIAGPGPISTTSGLATGPSPDAKDQIHLRGVFLPGQKGRRVFGHSPLPLVGVGAAGPTARAAVGCIRHAPRYSREGRTGRRGRGSPTGRCCHHTTIAAAIAIVLLLFVAVVVAAVAVVVVPKAATTTAAAAPFAIELGIKFILGGQNFHIGPIEEILVVIRRAQSLILGGLGIWLFSGRGWWRWYRNGG